eukprot:gene23262-biopygen4304
MQLAEGLLTEKRETVRVGVSRLLTARACTAQFGDKRRCSFADNAFPGPGITEQVHTELKEGRRAARQSPAAGTVRSMVLQTHDDIFFARSADCNTNLGLEQEHHPESYCEEVVYSLSLASGASVQFVGAGGGGRARTRDADFLRGRGGPLGRLVLFVRTPLRALSKRRKRRLDAPALRFPTGVLRSRLRRYPPPSDVFMRTGSQGPGAWEAGAATLACQKITKIISSDTGNRKKLQVVFDKSPFRSFQRRQKNAVWLGISLEN